MSRLLFLACKACGVEFERYRSDVKSTDAYCSRSCAGTAEQGLSIACDYCGTIRKVGPCQLRRARRHYCSLPCRLAHARATYDDHRARAEAERKRRARKRATIKDIGSHTTAEWEDLKRRAGQRCVKCHKKRPLQRDHITPLARGGDDRITNIQPLCVSCNASKGARVEYLL